MSQGFDTRIVSYEHIHSISPDDFKKLIDAIDPKANEVILDAMCGYGAVGKAILEQEPRANLFLLDESSVQVDRAIQNISNLDKGHFITSSLPHDNFSDNFFDKIVIKMGLHEVSLAQHLQILKEFNRILKLTGKIIVWDIMLNDNTQSLFQDIIREKDRLAGYDLLTTERYFFRENEFLKNTEEAGFTKVTEFHKISYRFSSKRRLESELKNDISKLKELNEFIRIRFPQNLKQLMNYEEKGDDIQFTITKKIYVLQK